MSPEGFFIHPDNQVLSGLRDTQGNFCGEHVLKRVMNSDVFILLGEPALGKSTVVDQIGNELDLRGIPYERVAYDDVLAEHISEKGGFHQEGFELNAKLVRRVVEARMRMAAIRGIVIFDTCAVGNKFPKNRSISAVEQLIGLAQQENPFFSKVSIVSLIGSLNKQLNHATIRQVLTITPSHLVVSILRDMFHIHLANIPDDVSLTELGEEIELITKRTAQEDDIMYIATEVTRESTTVLFDESIMAMPSIVVPPSFTPEERSYIQLRAIGMQRRIKRLGLSEDEWLIAINPEQEGQITRYANTFLRRDVS